jgi:transcriptional regulator of acetoin/glycerol metabolism
MRLFMRTQSKATDEALARIRAGANPYSAAKNSGISPNTIYRALKRIRIREQEKKGEQK